MTDEAEAERKVHPETALLSQTTFARIFCLLSQEQSAVQIRLHCNHVLEANMTFSDGGLTDANERDIVASLLSQILQCLCGRHVTPRESMSVVQLNPLVRATPSPQVSLLGFWVCE